MRQIWRALKPTLQYVMETEVHVYAFSIAANVLLSFWPFLTVLRTVCLDFLKLRGVDAAIEMALRDYFPGDTGTGQFVFRNMQYGASDLSLLSILLLLFTANGIFEPLEVALNRAWGIEKNRSFVRNQLVSMGLIFTCGFLALVSIGLSALEAPWMVRILVYKAAALPVSIFMIFLVFWILPNKRVNPRHVIAPAIFIGLALEGLKYINLLVWPFFFRKFWHEYLIFTHSVTIIFWSFLAAMVVLAGAELTARLEARRTGITQRITPPPPVPASAP